MKRPWSGKTIFERGELALAIFMTLILIGVHVIFFLHAGPLWRDEISSLTLATKPSFAEFWRFLPFDPFPASYFLLLRSWHAIGLGESDLQLRVLGLLIGLSLIGAFWFSCHSIDKSPPLWPLALFALNPLTLEAGDSLRPYGFGLIWVVFAFGLIWKMTFGEIRKRTVAFAFVAAVLSVQSLFTNAFILLATGTSAILLLLCAKEWSKLILIITIGLVAALTLLPYLPIIRATGEWSKIIANKNELTGVLAVARDALAEPGTAAYWTWLALGVGSIGSCLFAFSGRLTAIFDLKRKGVMFAGATLFITVVATIVFLCAAQYLVFPRYFLPTMGVAALSVHVFWGALPNRIATRAVSLILATFIVVLSVPSLYARANMRMTNCDKIAIAVEQRASSEDLIIVTSFFYGVSFQRYYHGQASWLAVPPVADFSLHRWDLLREAMARPDPMPDLLSHAETVLRNGHRLFLVGKLGPPLPEEPESLPPAPQTEFGWQMEPYVQSWKAELTYWIKHHTIHGNELSINDLQSVNWFERLGVFEASGWREP